MTRTTASSIIDHETQNEEWIVQCMKLDEALLHEQEEEEEHNYEEAKTLRLVGKAITTRAARLGTLEVALLDDNAIANPFTETLLNFTRQELDEQAASSKQLALMNKLVSPSNNAKKPGLQAQSQESSTKLDVDAFFEEYPKCMKENCHILESDNDDDDDDDSSCWSDEEIEYRKKKTIRSIDENPIDLTSSTRQETNRAPVRESSSSAGTSTKSHSRPSSAHGRPTTNTHNTLKPTSLHHHHQQQQRPGNPYTKNQQSTFSSQTNTTNNTVPNQHKASAPAFSYTPVDEDRPQSSSSWESHHRRDAASSRNAMSNNYNNHHHQRNNPNNNNTIPRSHQNRHAPTTTTYHGASSSSSTWEDHQNQQNPFQTAREIAAIHESSTSSGNRDHWDDSNARVGNSNPRQAGHKNNNPSKYQNPYGGTGMNNYHSLNPNDRPDDGTDAPRPNGGRPRIPESLRKKFQSPMLGASRKPVSSSSSSSSNKTSSTTMQQKQTNRPQSSNGKEKLKDNDEEEDELPEELQHLDKELVKKIQNEIIESGDTVTFDDIAGLEDVKQTVQEVVCWPMKRPDLFTGLRRAPNGLLLYGPPGTGKTLIGKAIAHESGATFFSISSSSLTSKWIGEGEKLVRTLFAVAAYREPAVVFIDEIDSLLTQRKSTENEASRRIKTEFLVQLDGTGTSGQGRVLVIGATNRPQELDEAARRRFIKRLYVPLPTEADRRVLLMVMLKKNNHVLVEAEMDRLARDTDGFSGADLKALCTDAAMGPIRQLGPRALEIDVGDVPPISFRHFKKSLKGTKPSVAPADLVQYIEWDAVYGSKRAHEDDDDDSDDDKS